MQTIFTSGVGVIRIQDYKYCFRSLALTGLVLSGCADPLFDSEDKVSLADAKGCYKLKERIYQCSIDGCRAWWEYPNICFDENGDWVESNGLKVMFGNVRSEESRFVGKLHRDSMICGEESYFGGCSIYRGFSFSDSVRREYYFEKTSSGIRINDSKTERTDVWGYVLDSLGMSRIKALKIPTPQYDPGVFEDSILDERYDRDIPDLL
jgi:hypothetical protein